MKFSEVLELMAICSTQITLLEMVEQIAEFAEQYKGLSFADFLRIFAHYCHIEGAKDLEPNATWIVVGDLLITAAEKLEVLYEPESEPVSLPLQVVKLIAECFRRMLVFQMLCLWTRALEEEQCRFADILAALAEYAEAEADRNPKTSLVWRLAVAEIRAAQKKANEKGQELP